MARHSSDGSEAFAGGLLGFGLAVALLLIAIVVLVVVSVATELWRVFQARAVHNAEAGWLLWGALAVLVGSWVLLGGMVATSPDLASFGLAVGAWLLFAFILLCEFIDCYYGRLEKPEPIPEAIPLSAVISFQPETSDEESLHSAPARDYQEV